jgi:glycine hydroxymethyltransferase
MSVVNSFAAYEDTAVFGSVFAELVRQQNQIELLASENIVSPAVLAAQGSIFTNKSAKSHSGPRDVGRHEFVDVIEDLAIQRAKRLFGCSFANVRPHSSAQANAAVCMALLKPGEKFFEMTQRADDPLACDVRPAFSGKCIKSISYDVRREDGHIDYHRIEQIALEHRPNLMIAGGIALSRQINFAQFRNIADSVGAKLVADMTHFAGLVAGDIHPSPFPHAHVVTSATDNTLRGPRGGFILTNDSEIAERINSAVSPGLQGSPLMHVIAAKAVAFGEALRPRFHRYTKNVVANARSLANALIARGYKVVTNGTDTHVVLVDLRPKGISGKQAEEALERAGLTSSRNSVPFDPRPPEETSGIQFGTLIGSTRGLEIKEFELIAELIVRTLDAARENLVEREVEKSIRGEVETLCRRFPIYERL